MEKLDHRLISLSKYWLTKGQFEQLSLQLKNDLNYGIKLSWIIITT